MGKRIGNLLGNVTKTEIYEYPGKNIIIKIRVELNTNNPIIPGLHIGNTIDGTTWIDFRYENLPQVCFHCSMVGHPEKFCRNAKLKVEEASPLGPWIRSNIYGRRVIEPKDRKFYSNPSMAKKFGQSSPPAPEELLQQLADLRIQEARGQQSTQNPLKRPYEATPKPNHNTSSLNSMIKTPSQTLSKEWTPYNNYNCTQMSIESPTEQPKKPRMESSAQKIQMAGLLKQASQEQ